MKIAFKRRCVCDVLCVWRVQGENQHPVLPRDARSHSAQLDVQRVKPGVFIDERAGWDRRLERVECIALPGPLTFASQWACPTNRPVCLHSLAGAFAGMQPQLPAEPERESPAKIPAGPGFTCTPRYGQKKHTMVCPNSPGCCGLAVPCGPPMASLPGDIGQVYLKAEIHSLKLAARACCDPGRDLEDSPGKQALYLEMLGRHIQSVSHSRQP